MSGMVDAPGATPAQPSTGPNQTKRKTGAPLTTRGIQVLIDVHANAAADRACEVLTHHLASLGKDAAWSFIQEATGGGQ